MRQSKANALVLLLVILGSISGMEAVASGAEAAGASGAGGLEADAAVAAVASGAEAAGAPDVQSVTAPAEPSGGASDDGQLFLDARPNRIIQVNAKSRVKKGSDWVIYKYSSQDLEAVYEGTIPADTTSNYYVIKLLNEDGSERRSYTLCRFVGTIRGDERYQLYEGDGFRGPNWKKGRGLIGWFVRVGRRNAVESITNALMKQNPNSISAGHQKGIEELLNHTSLDLVGGKMILVLRQQAVNQDTLDDQLGAALALTESEHSAPSGGTDGLGNQPGTGRRQFERRNSAEGSFLVGNRITFSEKSIAGPIKTLSGNLPDVNEIKEDRILDNGWGWTGWLKNDHAFDIICKEALNRIRTDNYTMKKGLTSAAKARETKAYITNYEITIKRNKYNAQVYLHDNGTFWFKMV